MSQHFLAIIFVSILILHLFLSTDSAVQPQQQIVYPRKLSPYKRPRKLNELHDIYSKLRRDMGSKNEFEYFQFPLIFRDTDDHYNPEDRNSKTMNRHENIVHKKKDVRQTTTHKPGKGTGSSEETNLIMAFKKVDNLLSKDFESDYKEINFKQIAANIYQGYVVWDYGSNTQNYDDSTNSSDSPTQSSDNQKYYPLTLEYRADQINALFSTDRYQYELNPLNEDLDSRNLLAIIPMANNSALTGANMGAHVLKRSRKASDAPLAFLDYGKYDHTQNSNNPSGRTHEADKKLSGPYVIEAVFYVPRKFITIPERHIPFLAAQINNILRHPTMKVDISLTLKYIRDYPPYYVYTDDPKNSLAYMRLYKGSTAPNVDVAILISNQIMSPMGGTIGYALVGAVCSKDASVVLAQDMGFDTAHVIAHEMGHLLGANHDMDTSCNTTTTSGIMHYYPTAQRRNVWSECSAHSIANVLRSGTADCLLQSDNDNYNLHNLPGQDVSADDQCRKNWGLGYYAHYEQSSCQVIKCKRHKVASRGEAPLDGTSCKNLENGETKLLDANSEEVCYRGICVKKDSIKSAKRGQWSSWGDWSKCEGFCPVGFRKRKRTCRFITEIKGTFCEGDTEEISVCTLPCTDGNSNSKAANQKLCDKQKPNSEFKPTSQYTCLVACYQAPNLFIFYIPVVDGTPFNQTALCIEGIVYSYS